ncbi:MAG TPA: outer membrane protein assembly factor BamA [Deltaproteobacteria bacterium]|nr:outer membrane protein assembly factor BamA [Deltaproteobacteria bacterium]
MITNKVTRSLGFFCLVTAFVFFIPAQAQELKKISVFPFQVYSKEDSAAIQASFYRILSEELKKEKLVRLVPADSFLRDKVIIDEKTAVQTGRSLGADFTIIGSLTKVGESLSVDAKVVDVKKAAISPAVFLEERGLENLGSIARQLKTEIVFRAGLIEKIAKVEVEGNRKIEDAAILNKIKSRAGDPYIQENITADIKTIFRMGLFLDVSASAASTPEGKIVTFSVLERGLISDIQIKGNKALGRNDIMEVLTIKVRETLDQEKIKADIGRIKNLYDSKGYYNAEINDVIETDGEKDFRVVLNIEENEKLYIKAITFEGNEAYSTKELKNMMDTAERRFFSFLSGDGLLNRDQLKQDIGKINAYYFNNGFIHAQVGEPEIKFDKKGLYINIPIKEGKRFKFGEISISGDVLQKPRNELSASLKITQGNNYNREQIIRDIDFLVQACNDEGYAYADVNPIVEIRDKEQLVDVNFQIIKGELVYINRIAISGNTVTRDKVIRRQLAIVEGDLYSSAKLKKSYENLNWLRYFEEVDFQTDKGPEEDKMNVNIRVREKNTGMFMIGAGYSAVDRAVIMAQVAQQNFLGYGQTLQLKASLGSSSNMYELSFVEPWLFDIPLWTKADLWKYRKEYDSYNLDTHGGGLTLGHPIWEKIVGYVGYNFSSNDIRDVKVNAPESISKQAGKRTTSSIGITLARNTTDDRMFPTKGTQSSVSVMYAGLGGNVKMVKYSAGASVYIPLFWDMVFVTKGRMGYIQNLDDSTDKIPIYERYVLGGITTIRGLRYVGPIDGGTADVIGGTTMMVFNVELVFPLIKNAGIKGVVFYDAGNAWNYGGAYKFDDLRQSVGGGIRWYSPIGPLRLEYGYPIDNNGLIDNDGGRWEFTIGMFM